MRRSPSIVPEADNREIYLALDDFGGKLGPPPRKDGHATG